MLLPGNAPGASLERSWAPALAYVLVEGLASPYGNPLDVFDRLHLRAAVAEVFSGLDLSGEDAWRTAARLRLLIARGDTPVAETFASQAFWDEGDVRWLGGVNESEGTLWFNKEAVEELLVWLHLPALLAAAAEPTGLTGALPAIETEVTRLRAAADGAGYKIGSLLAALARPSGDIFQEPPSEEPTAVALAELQAEAASGTELAEEPEPAEEEAASRA